MDGHRLLNMSITDGEHDHYHQEHQENQRRESDLQHLLTSSGDNPAHDRAHGLEDDEFADRARSLAASIHRVNNPVDSVQPLATHQPATLGIHDRLQQVINFEEPTTHENQATYDHLDHIPKLWTPFWIRISTLGALLLLFIIIILALALLWHFSEANNGFTVNSSTSHYAWTYTPVAFLLVTVGLWRQVDFYYRLLLPWDELRKGPVPASKSVLLDLVSPLKFVSLFVAFKRGYVPVVLSMSVFFILKIMTVFSAALLVVSSTTITSNSTSAVATKTFDASSFRLPSTEDSNFGPAPVYATIGNLIYGIPYTPGVQPDYAYIPVDLDAEMDKKLENATYTTHTEVLFPNLSCEQIGVQANGSIIVQANRTTASQMHNSIALKLPDGNMCQNWSDVQVFAMNPQKERTPPRQLEGTMQPVYCADEGESEETSVQPAGLLFTVTDIRYTQTILRNGTIINSTRTLLNMSNILCMSGYYILQANLSNSSAVQGPGGIYIRPSAVEDRTLEGLAKEDLVSAYAEILDASQGIFGLRQENQQTQMIPNTVFDLMSLTGNNTDLESFLDSSALKGAAETTFRRVMSHYFAQSLTKPTQTNLIATATYTAKRLHVSLVPFYIMLVGSVFCAASTIILILLSPRHLIPKDPSLIATSATILARSPEFNQLLSKQGSGNCSLETTLSACEFRSATTATEFGSNVFRLIVSQTTSPPRLSGKTASQKWWSPNMLLLPAFALALVGSVSIIAVLEALQRHSDNHLGLASVTEGADAVIYISCLPVILLLLVAAATNCVDFYVSLLSPWNKLAQGDSGGRKTLLSHLVGRLPPLALAKAIQTGHTGAIFSTSAAMLTGMSVIISAGLYYVQDVTSAAAPLELLRADVFQMDNRYSVFNDRGAAGMLSFLDNNDVAPSLGVFDELVFPTYSFASEQNLTSSLSDLSVGPFTSVEPAMRADLRCDVVPADNSQVTFVPSSQFYASDHYQIDTRYDLVESCQYGGSYRNASVAAFRNRFNVTSNDTILYGGHLLDLVFGRNSGSVSNYGEAHAATVGNSPSVGCPSLAFTFARFDSKAEVFEVTPLVCYQQIQNLQANVTYKINSTELDLDHEPIVVNSSLSLMTNPNSTSHSNSFDWRVQLNIERQMYGLDRTRLHSPNSSATYQFDAFFSFLFNNTWTQGPATLAGISNQQALIEAINHLYRKYMALAIHSNMRSAHPLADSDLQKRQSGSASIDMQWNTIQSRLVQDKTSKVILQVLLIMSAILSVLAFMLTSFHHLLPYNPCSIAGTMSLLAGSDLCWTTDGTPCDCCGKPQQGSWSHEENVDDESTAHVDPNVHHNPLHEQIIPPGAEWLDHIGFAAVFARRTYVLRWWRENRARSRLRRFGVDVQARPDGVLDDDWELGDQRSVEHEALEDLVRRGRRLFDRRDKRGKYQPADGRDRDSDGIMMTGIPTRTATIPRSAMRSPPLPGAMSPEGRRVRFHDEA